MGGMHPHRFHSGSDRIGGVPHDTPAGFGNYAETGEPQTGVSGSGKHDENDERE